LQAAGFCSPSFCNVSNGLASVRLAVSQPTARPIRRATSTATVEISVTSGKNPHRSRARCRNLRVLENEALTARGYEALEEGHCWMLSRIRRRRQGASSLNLYRSSGPRIRVRSRTNSVSTRSQTSARNAKRRRACANVNRRQGISSNSPRTRRRNPSREVVVRRSGPVGAGVVMSMVRSFQFRNSMGTTASSGPLTQRTAISCGV
jgi:hypothetical protein